MTAQRTLWISTLVAALGLTQVGSRAAVDVEDLRPGLIATYRDNAKAKPTEIVRLDPGIALSWKASESAHPRLSAEGGSAHWEGFVNILRAGNYRFGARVRGEAKLSVGGKEVLTASEKNETPELKWGPETRLESGAHPIVAQFSRTDSAARLEIYWQGPGFAAEPIPSDVVFHLPAKLPARFAADQLIERGRFLAEENNCISCHRPDANDKLGKGLATRQAPDLSAVGSRVSPGWIFHWIADPQKVNAGAAMPKLFAADEASLIEINAITHYLASLGGPFKTPAKPANPKDVIASAKSGEKTFNSVGCVACHRDNPPKTTQPSAVYGAPRNFTLGKLGSKTTPDKLAAYLANPAAIDPSGRMPNLLLEGKEAQDIANFLCQAKDSSIGELPAAPAKEKLVAALNKLQAKAEEITAFEKLQGDAQAIELGKRLVIAKGCNNCHNIAPGNKALPTHAASTTFDALKAGKNLSAGCLADDSAKGDTAPQFAFNEADRKALRVFFQEGAAGPGTPAPTYLVRVTMQRFNCLACHNRDGEGGLTSDLIEDLRRFEKAENSEAVVPPPLSGVGHKLRTPWLKQVLTQRGRARPWMGLRMPQFGDANVGLLPDSFAYVEGTEPDDSIHKVTLSAAKIEAGRTLVGKNGLGCISCHDLAGLPNSGTRGPDLAGMNQRVRHEWYERWLSQAQRMQPGTRMPIVFPDGKSLLPTVLDGNAVAQSDAMWAYLSLGPTLPLPAGLEPSIKGRILPVGERPVILRTFMPEAGGGAEYGSRCIAVGFPGGVNVNFDARSCRLTYAWSGNFLDVAPVWNDRGGTPAKLLGPKFWTSPVGCPLVMHDSNEPPEFATLAKDPAYGGVLADNKVFTGVKQLQFEGYSLDAGGVPTFRYQLEAGSKTPTMVTERIEPLRAAVAVGVLRRFTINVPAHGKPWLLAGEGTAEPRLLDAKGETQPLDVKAGRADISSESGMLVLPQGDHVIVFALSSAPKGAKWLVQKQGTNWQLILQLPLADKAGEQKLDLKVWSPYRADPALLKDLASSK